jgi:hypothetical protein
VSILLESIDDRDTFEDDVAEVCEYLARRADSPVELGWWIRGQPKTRAPRPPQVLEGLADHWTEELIEQACSIARLRPERELQATDIALAAGMRAAAP